MPSSTVREQVHALWDTLADFDAAQIDEALTCLLQGLCVIVDAQNADWIGVVQLADAQRDDPAGGWRPPVVRFLHPSEKLVAAVREQTRRLDQRLINEVAARIVDTAGRFRACRLCDVVAPEWFDSDFYRAYYRDCDREDAVYVAFPVNEDAESYFGIFRAVDQPRFTPQERDTLAYALRGIKWFHRQLLLSHGLLIAKAPMTPVERRVLQGLLTGQAEKQVAADLGQSYHTTHEYVTAIFRKFSVNNRAALMALWLGRVP
ncbi:MAG: helix-turn-helix transcriptional regulator [Sulfuritalea sp.]|jgi:DNA-binding CsgD family transcriptional regulator|nr:helix-turn-helix transcriptional regulator [Sulfuritalea sp.]